MILRPDSIIGNSIEFSLNCDIKDALNNHSSFVLNIISTFRKHLHFHLQRKLQAYSIPLKPNHVMYMSKEMEKV